MRYKIGDRCIVIHNNSHGFKIGAVVTIVDVFPGTHTYDATNGIFRQYLQDYDLKYKIPQLNKLIKLL
jgi:hypothetical protein